MMVACVAFTACDDDKFTTSQGALLTLPSDTLLLDTAISGEPTSTYSFVIRNHGSDGIRIAKASLLRGGETGFQVNIDGTYVNDAYDYPIEVRGKDSITVWVKLKAQPTGQDEAQKVEDALLLQLESGAVQQVVLLGYAQDVNLLAGAKFTSDTTLSSPRPYHVTGDLRVAQGATLTLAPGTLLLFSPQSSLIVEGTLKAAATRDSAIVFRGDRLDHMFTNQPYDRIPGQWRGITFASTSTGNVMEYCDVHSGTYGIRCDSSEASEEKLRIESSVVTNMKGDCLTLIGSSVFVGNSLITNALGNCVTIHGGDCHFVHCTIGNFYPFEGNRGRAMYVYNSYNGRPLPLRGATFENSIISGWSDDEIFTSFLDDNTEKTYLFRYCLLTTPAPDDLSEFPGCIFENTKDTLWGSKNFGKFDYDFLVFDFHLDSLSKARGSADPATARQYYPLDLDGRERLADDGKADMGCYEFRPAEME